MKKVIVDIDVTSFYDGYIEVPDGLTDDELKQYVEDHGDQMEIDWDTERIADIAIVSASYDED